MDKEILNKLIKNGAIGRIYSHNLEMVKNAKHKAFINSLEMLMKDVSALENKGGTNAQKSWSNPFTSNPNADRTSQNGDYDSSNWNQSASWSSNSSSRKQIKYIRYLIYILSKDYSSSSYGQIANEICKKHGIKSICTNNVNRSTAYHLIKELKGMVQTTKPKAKAKPTLSSGLPF